MTVNVAAVNDAPVAVDDTLAATEDTAVDLHGGAAAGQRHRCRRQPAVDRLGDAAATGGTAVLNGNGTVTYTPTANFNGAASFSYTVERRHGHQHTGDGDGQRRRRSTTRRLRQRHAGGDRGHRGDLHGGAAAGQRHRRRRRNAHCRSPR